MMPVGNDWLQYSFLKDDQQAGKVLCSICNSPFSVQHGDHSDILQDYQEKKTINCCGN
jgi:hypothetical protein